jgi:uncharacterized protein YggE
MTESSTTRLSVRGEARVMVPPDAVSLFCYMTVSRAEKAQSLRVAATVLDELVSELVALGGMPLTADNARAGLTWSASSMTTWVEHTYDKPVDGSETAEAVVAAVSVSIGLRDFDLLDQLQTALASHAEIRENSVRWLVDDDNPGWKDVRAAAIRAAIQIGSDYSVALGGSLESLEHLADAGLLGDETPTRAASPAWAAQSGGSNYEGGHGPSLNPVPQELRATIEARFIASIGPIAEPRSDAASQDA